MSKVEPLLEAHSETGNETNTQLTHNLYTAECIFSSIQYLFSPTNLIQLARLESYTLWSILKFKRHFSHLTRGTVHLQDNEENNERKNVIIDANIHCCNNVTQGHC
jgi:hypothetical protein